MIESKVFNMSLHSVFRNLLFKNGKIVELGAMIKDPALGKTLERIRDNPEDFYTGALAEDIVKDIQDAGGIITLDDLANYKVVKRKVLTDEIGDLTLYTMPVPSGGPVVTYILNILKGEIVCSTAFLLLFGESEKCMRFERMLLPQHTSNYIVQYFI